jgi:flavorubredoxin
MALRGKLRANRRRMDPMSRGQAEAETAPWRVARAARRCGAVVVLAVALVGCGESADRDVELPPLPLSSLSLWLDFNPAMRCYLSWLWGSFVPHFGGDDKTFVSIPDEGMDIALGSLRLQAMPAHYLHSSGNFHLYDAKAKLLFSGDVGAALLPPEMDGLFVQDFDKHIRHAEGFHRRWMGSNEAKLDWCERASRMRIDMLCPQHGAIYQGKDVERFINWLAELPVGSGIGTR